MRGMLLIFTLAYLVSGCAMQMQETTSKDSTAELLSNADKAYNAGDWKTAEQAYRDVIARDPAGYYAFFRLGNTLVKENRLDEAAQAYEDALMHDAGKSPVYNNLARIRLVQAQTALNASLSNLPPHDGSAAQVRYMLWQVKKLAQINLDEITQPIASK